MKKRHTIAIALLAIYVIIAQLVGFGLLHRCDNYVGEYMLPVPMECRLYNNDFGFILLALVPVVLIALYTKFGWPRDKH
jgi:hypothetical protein